MAPPSGPAAGPVAPVRRAAALLVLALVAAGLVLVAPTPPTASAAEEHVAEVETLTPALDVVPSEQAPVAEVGAEVLEPVGETTASATRAPERQVATSTDEQTFWMLGVGYEGGDGEPALVRVRQADGTWSEWVAVEVGAHSHDGEVPEGVEAGEAHVEGTDDGDHQVPNSDPIYVGDADGYELDLPATATDVVVHLVRDGEATVALDEAEGADAAGPAAGQPTIRSRSSWGAAPYRGSPDYASRITFAVVHHTVNSNGYSPSQVPSLLRGIQSYHQNSNGWDDIGYNFVVDRWGTIWEGRGGGVANRVIGAHAADANTGSVGAAVLGDFSGSTAPSEGVINALQTLIGWKLALDGVTPSAANVLGHRQAGSTQTACPGQRLFDRMGDVRFGALLYFNVISDPCYGSTYEPFCDVAPSHPFIDEILWVHDNGIADGFSDGTFRPGTAVSRQAMAAFLYRLADVPFVAPASGQSFSDVPRSSAFFTEIEWLRDEGIGDGYGDGTFRPTRTVSRQAMAAFMYRTAGEPPYDLPAEPAFSDVALDRVFALEIHWLAAEGISTGYGDGTFRPDVSVSRQAMAAFLQRLAGHLA